MSPKELEQFKVRIENGRVTVFDRDGYEMRYFEKLTTRTNDDQWRAILEIVSRAIADSEKREAKVRLQQIEEERRKLMEILDEA